MGDLIAMVKDAVVPLAGFMAVTAMLKRLLHEN